MSNPPDPSLFKKISDSLDLPGATMLEALGYLDAETSGSPKESPAVSAVKPILDSQEFTDGQIRALVMSVQNTVDMLKGKY